jgi:hypothetical protein
MPASFCPSCGKSVKPPLSTDRQFCSDCGWKSEAPEQPRDIGFEAVSKARNALNYQPAQTTVQKKIAKSQANLMGATGAVVGLIISLPSMWAATQTLKFQAILGIDLFTEYAIGICVVMFIGFLSGFGKGASIFQVDCPSCGHKHQVTDPGGACPACNTALYIDAEGNCQKTASRA